MSNRETTNPTAALLISRLPTTPALGPEEIAAAIGARTTTTIVRAIATGSLAACRIGGRYIIARAEAARWIEASAVEPDEAE